MFLVRAVQKSRPCMKSVLKIVSRIRFFYFNSINLLMRLLEHAQGRASSTRGDPKIVSLVAQRVLQVFDVVLKRRDWTRSSISRNLCPGLCTRCISQTLSFFRTRRMILLVRAGRPPGRNTCGRWMNEWIGSIDCWSETIISARCLR